MKLHKNRRKIASISSQRWAAYATAGVATALGGVTSAEADITYSGPINQPFTGTITNTFALDQAGDSFQLRHNGIFAGFYLYGIDSAMFRGYVGAANTAFRYVSKLASNVPVSAGAFIVHNTGAYATLAYSGSGQWAASGVGFIGFKFDGGDGTRYGWIRLNMNGSGAGNTFTLVDYAFGDVGDTITTGQVPEPGSLALLALGGAGLLAWRKRRRQQAAA